MSDGVQNGQSIKVFASVTSEVLAVPSDTVAQPQFKSMWVNVSGDVAISRDGGVTVVTYTAVPVGEFNLGSPCFLMAATGATIFLQDW